MVYLVKATGRAQCQKCSKKIDKDVYCLKALTGNYNSYGHTHLKCIFDNEITFIKAVLQEKAQEETNGN